MGAVPNCCIRSIDDGSQPQLVDTSRLTTVAKDFRGLWKQPAEPSYRGALIQVNVGSQPHGGGDKSSNGHRYDSIPIANGMIAAGMSCQVLHYNHEEHNAFFETCMGFDFIIFRCQPGQIKAAGGDQLLFDNGMLYLAKYGIRLWPDPICMETMGAQDALCKVSKLSIGLEDTVAYYTPQEFEVGFRKSMKFQPRVIKQNSGAGGRGIWIITLKSGDYCKSYGEAACRDDDVLLLTEASDDHTEEHTVGEFVEFCVNGRTDKAGHWTTKSAGKYLDKNSGGQLVDQRFCPRVVEGVLRFNCVFDKVVSIIHKKPKSGGVSAINLSGATYTYYKPDDPKFYSLTQTFEKQDMKLLMPALGLADDNPPLWWAADMICASLPEEEDRWIVAEFSCSCVDIFKCLPACCTDENPNATYEHIPENDLEEALALGEFMGLKAKAYLDNTRS